MNAVEARPAPNEHQFMSSVMRAGCSYHSGRRATLPTPKRLDIDKRRVAGAPGHFHPAQYRKPRDT